ncbi:Hypothetical predicted protein [Podarcis lilfordi]|uniref:Uncharacterized protein n=1 Tax=Podarcis lilfordi TaxID=74358 RepID=A0AA35PM49_9SAUR|nr:Hypothetical predicted protein [Podarcis lilfordi]
MALSGVNQSHVQPVWAEIPSRSADIGAQAVPSSRVPIRTQLLTIIYKSVYRRILEEGEGDPSNPSALPAQNLLADPVNSRVPNQDTQEEEMDIFSEAVLIVNALL